MSGVDGYQCKALSGRHATEVSMGQPNLTEPGPIGQLSSETFGLCRQLLQSRDGIGIRIRGPGLARSSGSCWEVSRSQNPGEESAAEQPSLERPQAQLHPWRTFQLPP
jgi:hypothetical protein